MRNIFHFIIFFFVLVVIAMAVSTAQTVQLTDINISPAKIGKNLVPNYSFEDIEPDGIPKGWLWNKGNREIGDGFRGNWEIGDGFSNSINSLLE